MFNKLELWVEKIARRVFWDEIRFTGQKMKSRSGDTPTIPTMLDDGAKLPVRAHDTDAGADLYCMSDVVVPAHDSVEIDTGVHVQLPAGTVGMVKSKSGLNIRACITCEGVIDEGYTGSIKLRVYNHGDYDYTFAAGDKVTQLVVMPVVYPSYVEVVTIAGGKRGDGGLGSTGK